MRWILTICVLCASFVNNMFLCCQLSWSHAVERVRERERGEKIRSGEEKKKIEWKWSIDCVAALSSRHFHTSDVSWKLIGIISHFSCQQRKFIHSAKHENGRETKIYHFISHSNFICVRRTHFVPLLKLAIEYRWLLMHGSRLAWHDPSRMPDNWCPYLAEHTFNVHHRVFYWWSCHTGTHI